MTDFDDDDQWFAGLMAALGLVAAVLISSIPILEFMEAGYSVGVAIGLTLLIVAGTVVGFVLVLGFVWLLGGLVLHGRENINAWRERLE